MLGRVLSIDLAINNLNDLGLCLLEVESQGKSRATFLSPRDDLWLTALPQADELAAKITEFAREHKVRVAMIDGPQGWKSPESAILHSRVCERILHTPGKTGKKGQVKPASWTRFVEYSTTLFFELLRLGGSQVCTPTATVPTKGFLAVEIFPSSAWPRLGMEPLPGKKKAIPQDMESRLRMISQLFNLEISGDLGHDRLQALVSGVAGIAILRRNPHGYVSEGLPPVLRDGFLVEGYIVNPRLGPSLVKDWMRAQEDTPNRRFK
jgi:hypothetical protein